METIIKKPIRSRLSFISGNNTGEFDKESATKLRNASKGNKSLVYAMTEANENGLSNEEVIHKQEKYGLNDIRSEKAPAWYIQFLRAFVNPFIGVLIIIATASLFTDVILQGPGERDYTTVTIVTVMVFLSSIIRFWQEYRSNKAAEQLKNMVKTTATVLRREGGKQEIQIKNLVPGDIIYLSAGDMLPGDCRIMQSKDLFISQSILTGESLPVEKKETVIPDAESKSPIELENICFMGTNVVSGTAVALIITTGNETYFGSISKGISGKRTETSFDKGVKSVSWLLIRFMLVMVPLVFLINGFLKHDWTEAFLFALAVAVGLTPEMLPMIVTANLAKGALNMSKHKVIVKRLNAIQNIGA
ncbi:MAG TPA: HAD-IC family P-type ATPase, partial [Bacteroidia bacterium]|nr:HAD-IC family P-type ATPase [Bacteroidia bacterium]